MSLFLDNGFVNMPRLFASRLPFIFVVGGRGTGKTYGALEYVRKQALDGKKFIYMRRTQDQVDKISQDDFSPFKSVDELTGTITTVQKMAGKTFSFIDAPSDKTLGYCFALSTFAKMRGFDASDVSTLVFDEFIPEKHERPIKNEAEAFFNAVETINRNRELAGLPALRMWLLSNANRIDNDIFTGLGIVADVEKMLKAGKHHKYYKDRGLAVHIMPPSADFIEEKSKTALYKLTKGTRFYDMALNNEFAYDDFSFVGYENIAGYVPVCAIDSAYIYQRKNSQRYYVTYSPCKCPHYDSSIKSDVIAFQRDYGVILHDPFVYGCIKFESYALKSMLIDLIL